MADKELERLNEKMIETYKKLVAVYEKELEEQKNKYEEIVALLETRVDFIIRNSDNKHLLLALRKKESAPIN